MNSEKFMDFLEKQNLLERAKENASCFKNIIKNCLRVEDEELIVIGDIGFNDRPLAPILAGSYYLAAKEMGIPVRIAVQEPKIKGDYADKKIVDLLYGLNKRNTIVMCLSGRLGSIPELGNSFRTYAHENYHKFISTTSLGRVGIDKVNDVISAIDIDYEKMQREGTRLKEILDNGNEIRVETSAGTKLKIGIEGKKALLNTGDYSKPRMGGNIPAGEVYIAPKWKQTEGKVIIDGSSSCMDGTQLIKEPIKIEIEKGEIVSINGGREAERLKKTIDWACKKAKYPWGIKRIGEFGIGINPGASIIGATIVDEKAVDTAHIAFGSNYWFGGTIYAIVHLDQVFKNPRIYVDGEEIKVYNKRQK